MLDVDAGETCDDASSAPCSIDCDDADPCTVDVREGSADSCDVTCTHEPVAVSNTGDGCCPQGAHSLEDVDCAPVCGNDVPEVGEACDPCPESCADTDACSVDVLSGSAAECSATCTHAPIVDPADGDGCCPMGADATLDSDCSPTCGNGTIEAGEDCDGEAACRANCTFRFHPSLVHRYTFDGPRIGEDSTRAVDSFGGSDGTITGDTLDGDGKLTLAGGSGGGFVNLPNGMLSALTDVTIEVWVSWRGGEPNQAIFDFGMNSAGEDSSSGEGTSFLFVSPEGLGGRLDVCLNTTPLADDIDASHRVDASSALPQNTTWHLAATFSDPGAGQRKSLKLYRDGRLVAGGDGNIPLRTDGSDNVLASVDDRNVWIGRANYPVDRFGGTLYEFRIYDRALTAAELASSFAAGPDPAP